jgi:hypothetical protein
VGGTVSIYKLKLFLNGSPKQLNDHRPVDIVLVAIEVGGGSNRLTSLIGF